MGLFTTIGHCLVDVATVKLADKCGRPGGKIQTTVCHGSLRDFRFTENNLADDDNATDDDNNADDKGNDENYDNDNA